MSRKSVKVVLDEYVEDGLGLPFPVVLHNSVVEKRDAETGEIIGHAIPDFDALMAAIAMTRALCPVRLAGSEMRFMRRIIGMNSKSFAEALQINPSTYSRFENDKDHMGGFVEQILRQYVCDALKDRAPAIDYTPKKIIDLRITNSRPEGMRQVFTRVILKDAITRSRTQEWDALPRAA